MEPAVKEAQQHLLARRRALARLHGACTTEEKELREAPTPDWVDQASDSGAVDLLVKLGERERAELVEIDAALQRIEAGTFGTCQECGNPIGRDRLRALPQARLCLACSA